MDLKLLTFQKISIMFNTFFILLAFTILLPDIYDCKHFNPNFEIDKIRDSLISNLVYCFEGAISFLQWLTLCTKLPNEFPEIDEQTLECLKGKMGVLRYF